MISLIPRFKPSIEFEEILKVFKINSNSSVKIFEEDFKKYIGIDGAGYSFSYGRTALYAYLKFTIPKGSEVICSSYTCVVVAHAIVKSGMTPIFVDVEDKSWKINQELLLANITEKTRAVILTSLFGDSEPFELINKIKEKNQNVKIIIDDCHNIKRHTNYHSDVDAYFYGFGISKQITTVFGGYLLVLNKIDQELISQKILQMLKPKEILYSFSRRIYLLLVFFSFNKYLYKITNFLEVNHLIDRFTKHFDESLIDLPEDSFYKMNAFEASLGSIQLKKYDALLAHRLKISRLYQDNISNTNLNKFEWMEDSTYSHFNIRCTQRANLLSYMLRNGVQLGELFNYEIPSMSSYSNARYIHNIDRNAYRLSLEIVNLPVWVSEKEAKKVIQLLNNFQT